MTDPYPVESLISFAVASVEAARVVETPFLRLELDQVFPHDVYATMLRLMPLAADYRPVSGRAKRNNRPDGTPTRVKIDLFPEYIRHLPGEKRGFWDLVGRALRSAAVQSAFTSRLAPELERRFGVGIGALGLYAVPILTRDIPGYRIPPHTD